MTSRRKRDTHYSQETFAETKIESERHRLRHQWRLHDHHIIAAKLAQGRSVDGVRFGGPSAGHVWWRLQLFPNGAEGDDEVTLFLGCQHEGYEAPTGGRFLIAILDHDGRKLAHSAEEPYEDNKGVKGWAWPKFCPRSLIANEKSIDIVCEIEYYGGEPIISTNAVPDLEKLALEQGVALSS